MFVYTIFVVNNYVGRNENEPCLWNLNHMKYGTLSSPAKKSLNHEIVESFVKTKVLKKTWFEAFSLDLWKVQKTTFCPKWMVEKGQKSLFDQNLPIICLVTHIKPIWVYLESQIDHVFAFKI